MAASRRGWWCSVLCRWLLGRRVRQRSPVPPPTRAASLTCLAVAAEGVDVTLGDFEIATKDSDISKVSLPERQRL